MLNIAGSVPSFAKPLSIPGVHFGSAKKISQPVLKKLHNQFKPVCYCCYFALLVLQGRRSRSGRSGGRQTNLSAPNLRAAQNVGVAEALQHCCNDFSHTHMHVYNSTCSSRDVHTRATWPSVSHSFNQLKRLTFQSDSLVQRARRGVSGLNGVTRSAGCTMMSNRRCILLPLYAL